LISIGRDALIKRIFDLALSFLFILITFPIWLIISIAVKLDSKGPIFYRGIRVGKEGEKFRIFKFRTMMEDAKEKGPAITGSEDKRITRVGKILRKYKLDEMPQLINVIRGEMSIIGPRPEDPKYVKHYSERQKRVLNVRPGMASPAFIKYRHEEEILNNVGEENLDEVYQRDILPDKLEMDLAYIKNRSLIFDLRIFIQAALSLFMFDENDQRE